VAEYAETAYLIAVMGDDYEEAERLVSDMLPGEVEALHRQLRKAATWLEGWGA
jgi:hypothetical protein